MLNTKACKSQYVLYTSLCTDDAISPITKWIKYKCTRPKSLQVGLPRFLRTMLVGQYSHCYSKSIINKPSLAQNNGIPNKFPVSVAVSTKNAFIAVRYLLTRDSLSCFYFVQEHIVNHNFNTLREEDASFAAINLCSAVS